MLNFFIVDTENLYIFSDSTLTRDHPQNTLMFVSNRHVVPIEIEAFTKTSIIAL